LLVNTTQFNNPYRRKPSIDYSSSAATYTNTRYNSKPLEVRQQTFKGFYNFMEGLVATKTYKIPKSLSEFTFSTLKKVSESQQHTAYSKIVDDFVTAVKKDGQFRKKLNIAGDWAINIAKDNLPELPQKGILRKFAETVFSPIIGLYNLHKSVLRSEFGKKIAPKMHANLVKEKAYEDLISQYKGFVGLNNSIKIWENSYRQFSGNHHWAVGESFLIPEDVLLKNINSKRTLSFDRNKGKYSTKSLMLGNRLTSGLVYSVYLATDAYNTTMRFSGDKDESSRQRKSRFVQENARIGLSLYLQNMIFSTMEHSMNKSLATALLASGASVALSEIIGRQLVSKPIMPSDKKTLDKMEHEMMTKKGILPTIGRLMTRVKKPEHKNIVPAVATNSNAKSNNPFTPTSLNINSKIAFKGFEKEFAMFDSKFVKGMFDFMEEFDPQQLKYYKNIISDELKRVKTLNEKDVSNLPLEDLLKTFAEIPVGYKTSTEGKLVQSVFAPYYWVKNGVNSVKKMFKNVAPTLKHKDMLDFVKKEKLDSDYKTFLEGRLSLPAWGNGNLTPAEKEAKILEEFVKMKGKVRQEIQAVKNFMLWLDKQVKLNKFDLGDLKPADRKILKDAIKKSMTTSDGSTHLEYDGNTLAQLNIHLARAITTVFLVTDAYNLTMQYSNDNKNAASGSAKDRLVQESARISVSAYMLGFIHTLLSKVCNSGLIGAFGVTALTSVTNDTLTRLIVGVPLTPQSKESLDKNYPKK